MRQYNIKESKGEGADLLCIGKWVLLLDSVSSIMSPLPDTPDMPDL